MPRSNTDNAQPVAISIAYTDGSAYENGTAEARAGAGVWFGKEDERNIFLRLPGPNQTNNAAEIRALLEQVLAAVQSEEIMTITDSKYVIEGLCFHLKRWEDSGWVGVSNSDIWRATVAALRQRNTPVYSQWVKGHSGDIGNEGADELAGKGAQLDDSEAVQAETEICHEFNVDGARLRSTAGITERSSAQMLVKQVTAMIKDVNGVEPLHTRLWRSIRHKDVSRPIRGFLWKALQNTFKIGAFWERLGPQYAARVTESMEHILVECSIEGQATLWNLARELWERAGHKWITPTYGVALGATLVQIKTAEGKVDSAATRLYRIMMTETVHLIWKARCQRRIQRGNDAPTTWHTSDEIRNLWVGTMNRRLTVDRMLVNKHRYGSRALKKSMVLSTWKGTLLIERSLPEDWIDQRGVLVGIAPRGRHRAPH
ncbi:ribonuclease H-like protein [Armillaria borealis]|uniref:ribonuclease H n=1 Tax=Armillaria borealis TaxID=47425 RepID=A0AA39JPB8_9AGAR|nr:ribonuclease H-like protein [Armillaria borealis]